MVNLQLLDINKRTQKNLVGPQRSNLQFSNTVVVFLLRNIYIMFHNNNEYLGN